MLYFLLIVFLFTLSTGELLRETPPSRALATAASLSIPAAQTSDTPEDRENSLALRAAAAQPIFWKASAAGAPSDHLKRVRILGINDFHGHLSGSQRIEGRPVGGAAVLAAYLRAAGEGAFIVHAGDHVGASPPESSFFQDEPSIAFLNLLGNRYCSAEDRLNSRCNLVGTPGNHEFDEGVKELRRLIEGGDHPSGPFFESPYRGAHFPYVSANVVDRASGRPILPPFAIKLVDHVQIAFIGAVLTETPTIVPPTGVGELAFSDEAASINRVVRQLRDEHGIRAFIVLLHQGGRQPSYQGPTQPDRPVDGRELEQIVWRLDDDVDVVVSGHSHAFTNALMRTAAGKEILVTQAFSYGTAYADIDVALDGDTGDIVAKRAAIVTAFADDGPGRHPESDVAALVAQAEAAVGTRVERTIIVSAQSILRQENEAGESALGNLIADAQRAALGTDFAFMNPGGIRTDIPSGPVRYRDLFALHPFGNVLVRLSLTGEEIYEVLNQQWAGQTRPRMLKVSGLSYRWDSRRPVGDRVIEVRRGNAPIDRQARYSVTVNDFLAAGGDNFTVLTRGRRGIGGVLDLDALITYLESQVQPVTAAIDGRIERVDEAAR